MLTIAEQAGQIVSRFEQNGFSYEIKSLTYEHVSHFAIPMRRNTWLLKLLVIFLAASALAAWICTLFQV